MTNKFEQLLDYLVNEEMDKANELFHEIVVEKSRDIYENLIAEEAAEDEEEMDEAQEDDEEDDEEELDEETTLEIGGDPTDAMAGDMGAPGADMGDDGMDDMDDMGGDDMAGDLGDEGGSTEDRIDDLEDALEELKAEFEALMADEEHEPEHHDGVDDPDFGDEEGEEDDEEGEENPFGGEEDDSEDDEDEGMFESRQRVREYRDTVGNDWEKNSMKTPGPIGSGKGDKAGQTDVSNTPSPVSSGKGKPTTGATAHNILANTKGVGEMSGTSPNMDKGSRGLVGATKGEFTKGVEKNISNKANSSMKSGATLSKVSGGHGAEKRGSGGEGQGWGTGKGDKAGQTGSVNTKSPLTGAPNRNA
jgi:hypothetical protein